MIMRTFAMFIISIGWLALGSCRGISSYEAQIPTITPTVLFERAVLFHGPDGNDVPVEPGEYYLTTELPNLKLFGLSSQKAMLIKGVLREHGEFIFNSIARSETDEKHPDMHRLALLLPGGDAVETVGFYTTIQSSGISLMDWEATKYPCPENDSVPILLDDKSAANLVPKTVPGELVFSYKKLVTQEEKSAFLKHADPLEIRMMPDRTGRLGIIKLKDEQDLVSTLKMLQRDPAIDFIEPNFIYYLTQAAVRPNEFQNPPFPNSFAPLEHIQAPLAWSRVRDTRNITVAVVDGGFYVRHPDLQGRLLPGFDFADGDTTIGPNQTWPGHDHGTHVAGIIGATGNNGVQGNNDFAGVGLSWTATILPLKAGFCGRDDNDRLTCTLLTSAAIAAAVNFAVNNNATIINLSLGSRACSVAIGRAILYASARGILVSAAAGNIQDDDLERNNDVDPVYPANLPLANIISVANTMLPRLGVPEDLHPTSHFGKTTVHLAAPGTDIVSTVEPINTNPPFGRMTGTSMSAPIVAGAAALLTAQHPTWTPGQVKEALLASVDPVASLLDRTITGGRLNLASATTYELWSFLRISHQNGLAGYDLAHPADRAVALDFNNDGRDDLLLYRPGAGGQAWLLQSNGNGTFTVVTAGRGIAGYDLAHPADRAVALDFNNDGRDDLLLYRPGAGGQAWLLQSNGNGTFTVVTAGGGIAGYDLTSSADRAVTLDFNNDGRDDLFLYRPGAGGQAWLLQSNGDGTFTPRRREKTLAGYDLASSADEAIPIDYDGDRSKDLMIIRPGQGLSLLVRGVTN